MEYLKNKGRDDGDFFHADKHQVIPHFNTINLGKHGQACPNYLNNRIAKSFAISQDRRRGWSYFLCRLVSQLSINRYYRFWWVCTQNNKYAVPFEYLKKESGYEVDVLHANKHESLLQVDNIISG